MKYMVFTKSYDYEKQQITIICPFCKEEHTHPHVSGPTSDPGLYPAKCRTKTGDAKDRGYTIFFEKNSDAAPQEPDLCSFHGLPLTNQGMCRRCLNGADFYK